MYTLRVLLVSLAGFAALNSAVFRSSFYNRILDPASSTGLFERFLFIEQERKLDGPNQVLAIGDSRMALMPRVANTLKQETGYTFASVAVPGTSPRVWYYMLRTVDPRADRYAAVVITLDSYNDDEPLEHLADRYFDLRFLPGHLRLSDLWELASSFDEWPNRWEAARTVLFRGSAYSADFQDFLLHPSERLADADLSHRESKNWFYEFVGPSTTMEGVAIDWKSRTMTVPADRDAAQKQRYEAWLLRPVVPYSGEHTKYLRRWLGKIYEHYKGSRTRLLFVRLPRGPFLRPDLPPARANSAVREIGSRPGVTLVDEHMFDNLETPALFQDEMHLNQQGVDQFSLRLTREIRKILGPPR